jgi:hypothetical protein
MVSESLRGTSRMGNGPRGEWVLHAGAWIDRVLTWGLDPDEQSALLQERGADRFDHLADPDASVNRTWLIRGGVVLWAAALGNAIAQVGWGVVDAGTGTSRGAAFMVAIGCVAGAVLLRRLRDVPITN